MLNKATMTTQFGRIALVAGTLLLACDPSLAQAPRFRADGFDADAYGRREGYPSCKGTEYYRQQRCRVGALSQYDELFPARTIAASGAPTSLKRAAIEPSLQYSFAGQTRDLDRYLDLHPITGFLIARDDTILLERYQYDRTEKHRLTSFSMAKTITAMLLGLAVKEGAIRSIDDAAETYVPGLSGTEYGRSSIKSLPRMSSGVSFREVYTDATSDILTLARLTLGQDRGGSLAALKRFNTRVAQPGERFSYSSAETLVLGLVLSHATRRNVSDFTREKLWQPLGAEADASWTIDGSGHEITFAYYNAVLRDWARLGLLLANDGTWQGKSIIPSDWLQAATTVPPSDAPLQQADPVHSFAYGYQTWLFPGNRRMFALRGLGGQRILVDPQSKLVLVQTAVRAAQDPSADRELLVLWSVALSQLP
jgi:CubicO group peptidase (beta-lactamase class C family)